MKALECFNEFKTRRWNEVFITLKEYELFKNLSFTFKFVTNLIKIGSIFEERAKNNPLWIMLKHTFLEIEQNDFFEVFNVLGT